MSQSRRERMLKVIDDHPGVPPYMFYLHHLGRCDEALDWLIRNRLTGKHFLEWMKNVHGNSIVNVMSQILKQLERKTEDPRAIIVGRDYF